MFKTAAEVKQEKHDAAVERVRQERDRLLAASDWMMLPDAPVDATAAQAYRQALRDLPEQSGFPDAVTWPEM